MTDAPFVVAGWIGTAAAVALYAAAIAVRSRRALRARPQHDRSLR